MTQMQQMVEGQNNAHVVFNNVGDTLSAAGIYGKRHAVTAGLIWGYYGGFYAGNTIADGYVTLADNATNYVVVLRSSGVVSVSTSSTNSLNPLYAKLYKLTTVSGVVTTVLDQRMDANGLLIGDTRKVPRRTSGLATGECFATSSNVAVGAQEIGAVCSIYNDSGSSISITESSITLRLAGTATTGTRTLAQRGMATLWFNASNEAVISGAGVS